MEKKLPKVYANNVSLNDNNRKFYYKKSDSVDIIDSVDVFTKSKFELSVSQKINKIFTSSRYVYKALVDITLESGIVSKKIIGRNKNSLITMENELININEIIDIKFTNEE